MWVVCAGNEPGWYVKYRGEKSDPEDIRFYGPFQTYNFACLKQKIENHKEKNKPIIVYPKVGGNGWVR